MTCLDYNSVTNRNSRVIVTALVALTAGCAVDPPAPKATVWTDGDFDDWEGVTPAVLDPIGDVPAGSPVDIGGIAVQDDPRFLHFLIDLGHTVTVQGLRGSVELVLDVDADAVPGAGGPYGGVEGAVGAAFAAVLQLQRGAVEAGGAWRGRRCAAGA